MKYKSLSRRGPIWYYYGIGTPVNVLEIVEIKEVRIHDGNLLFSRNCRKNRSQDISRNNRSLASCYFVEIVEIIEVRIHDGNM